jgi:hypothetical protein
MSKLIKVHPEFLRIARVESVLGIDEGCRAAEFLHFGNDLQGQGRLSRRLGTIDLDHPTAR